MPAQATRPTIWSLCDGNSGILYPRSEEGTPARAGQILDIWHVRSRDGRKRWDAPKEIWTGHGSDLLSAIQLRNGRLVLPFSYAGDRSWSKRGGGFLDFTYVGRYSVSTLYSDDGGDTWQASSDELSVQTPDLGTYGADEPVLLQLKDGRVWMLIRTQRGRFYESFSDDGARWTPARPSRLISSDSPAGLLRLKGGGILLFSNACLRYPYAYGARNVLHAAVSEDEGRTWRGFREVVRDPLRNQPPANHADYGIAYTFPTLTASGKVLFSNWVQSGRDRTFRLLDPEWICQTRQKCDFSRGLDDWSIFGSRGVELQSDPQEPASRVMALRKADRDWPAAAVWNFPIGAKGRLKMQVMLRPGFGGTLLGLTDHFSVPWDLEDQFYNVFNLSIAAGGERFSGVKLAPNRWYEIVFEWNTNRRQCSVSVDGRAAGVLQDNRHSSGVNYLRLRSVSLNPDGGLLVRSVDADVSASWPAQRTIPHESGVGRSRAASVRKPASPASWTSRGSCLSCCAGTSPGKRCAPRGSS